MKLIINEKKLYNFVETNKYKNIYNYTKMKN